jgi:hypothetical protein
MYKPILVSLFIRHEGEKTRWSGGERKRTRMEKERKKRMGSKGSITEVIELCKMKNGRGTQNLHSLSL